MPSCLPPAQVITLEGWVDIMYYVMDAHSFYNFIYFILLIIVSGGTRRVPGWVGWPAPAAVPAVGAGTASLRSLSSCSRGRPGARLSI